MEAHTRRIYNMIGLAMKANSLASGTFMTEKTIKNGMAKLVIISNDAAKNAKKSILNATNYYQVKLKVFGKSEELGRAIGKDSRVMVAVTDSGLARKIAAMIDADG